MGKIRLLPDEVASQVAAGEVVERPASVVKELVENSLDAGAMRLTVEFAGAGTQLIRVTDDGCGMDREDALLSLERHATSKIRGAGDLARVTTMGFRGEAVPSIASVSRFRLLTRPQDATAGTEVVVSGGRIESVGDTGVAPGTTVEVRSLFFNLPARRKFLRGEETESAHIVHLMQALALAHPEVAMSLLRDGRTLWQLAPCADLGVRLRDLFGEDLCKRLVRMDPFEENGIALSGFLAKPGEGRPDRDQQFVILNGRLVQCPAIFQSLREAYAEVLPKGRHPLAVLHVSMDPLAFDCNVHPAKREIRLHRPDQLRQAVFSAARQLLESIRHVPPPTRDPRPAPPPAEPASFAQAPTEPITILPPSQREWKMETREEIPFRVIGGLADRWLVLEGAEGLVLLNIRAASERILFESLRREMASGVIPTQRLLLPEIFEFPPKDSVWIAEHLPQLEAAGFCLEPFGGDSFKVEALPSVLADREPRTALLDLCDSLRASGSMAPASQADDAIVRSVSAIAALDGFSYEEKRASDLVRQLLRCDLPYASPRGKPTMIQWSFTELDRKFGVA